jgi:hypothetical protein
MIVFIRIVSKLLTLCIIVTKRLRGTRGTVRTRQTVWLIRYFLTSGIRLLSWLLCAVRHTPLHRKVLVDCLIGTTLLHKERDTPNRFGWMNPLSQFTPDAGNATPYFGYGNVEKRIHLNVSVTG